MELFINLIGLFLFWWGGNIIQSWTESEYKSMKKYKAILVVFGFILLISGGYLAIGR